MFSLAVSRAARMTRTSHQAVVVSTTSRFFHASLTAEAKLNVEGLASKVDLQGTNVLVRVDLNVPLAKVRLCCVSSVGCLVLWSFSLTSDVCSPLLTPTPPP